MYPTANVFYGAGSEEPWRPLGDTARPHKNTDKYAQLSLSASRMLPPEATTEQAIRRMGADGALAL